MQDTDDIELLRCYAEDHSEEAFATLVQRHLNLVYSVALRHVQNSHHAEEIAQAVFVILARKAKSLRRGTIISGWLYHAARLTAANFVRSEIQRGRREQAAHMQTVLNEAEPEIWGQLAPLLDAAMAGLGEVDRNAVVLRFFEGKKIGEVGTALGLGEEAAKKRINRAVEKLRGFFSKRGIVVTAAVLTGVISANSVQAAPAALANAATAIALASGIPGGASTLTLIKGTLKVMAWAKAKTAIIAGAVVLLAGGITVVSVKAVSHHEGELAPSSDAAVLQGSWSGQETGAGNGSVSIVFQGAKIEFHGANPQEWYKATFSLREDTHPKQLVAVVTDCPDPRYVGKTSYAIYQVQNGTLTLVGNEPGEPGLPATFDAPGARKFVFTKK